MFILACYVLITSKKGLGDLAFAPPLDVRSIVKNWKSS